MCHCGLDITEEQHAQAYEDYKARQKAKGVVQVSDESVCNCIKGRYIIEHDRPNNAIMVFDDENGVVINIDIVNRTFKAHALQC